MNLSNYELPDARLEHVGAAGPARVAAAEAALAAAVPVAGQSAIPNRTNRVLAGSPRDSRPSMRGAAAPRIAAQRPNPALARQRELAFSGPRPTQRWPLWLVVTISASALVAAGYLGALVQLSTSYAPIPRLTRLASESPSAAVVPAPAPARSAASSAGMNDAVVTTAVTPAPARQHTPQPAARAQVPARPWKARPVTHAVASQPTAAAINAELYRQKPPVMTIRRLAADESTTVHASQSTPARLDRHDMSPGSEGARP